jgi:hypothetical protein
MCDLQFNVCLLDFVVILEIFQVLRYGGNWGIATGRRGEPVILNLWENSQCLIKDDKAKSKCFDSTRPLHESRMHGLSLLLMNIYSSVGQVCPRGSF